MPLAVRPGFEQCECPGPHPSKLVYDKHHLRPLAWSGDDSADNRAIACPNAHRLAHHLLNRMKRHGGPLPYLQTVGYGRYPKALAHEGWALMLAGGVTTEQLSELPDVPLG